MRYLCFVLLLLTFYSCQRPDSPYIDSQNIRAWLAFQIKASQQSSLEKAEQERPKNEPFDDKERIERAFNGEIFSLEERLQHLQDNFLANWKKRYGFYLIPEDTYWLSHEGKWLLLIRLPELPLKNALFRAGKSFESFIPYTGSLNYDPKYYEEPVSEYHIPPEVLRFPMDLHFEDGISLGKQHFFRREGGRLCQADYQIKAGARKEARGPGNHQELPQLQRAGTWHFYDAQNQLALSLRYEGGQTAELTWPDGQTGSKTLSYLDELYQGSVAAALLLLLLTLIAYFFRQRIAWKQKRATVPMGLLTWILVMGLLFILVRQLLSDWALFFHPEADYAYEGPFLLLQILFIRLLIFARKPQWLLIGLSGLLFFTNMSYILYSARLGLAKILGV